MNMVNITLAEIHYQFPYVKRLHLGLSSADLSCHSDSLSSCTDRIATLSFWIEY